MAATSDTQPSHHTFPSPCWSRASGKVDRSKAGLPHSTPIFCPSWNRGCFIPTAQAKPACCPCAQTRCL